MSNRDYGYSVFINCPFDRAYRGMFEALVFTIQDCGFIPRCSLEVADTSQNRLDVIMALMEECGLAVHDICRTEADRHGLPRFNMPLELGLFLGAKRFGSARQKRKGCLVLDRSKYRYRRFCSDIAGQDITSHNDRPRRLVRAVRDWLRCASQDQSTVMPSGSVVFERYQAFQQDLPQLCSEVRLRRRELAFGDLVVVVDNWLHVNELMLAHAGP